MPQKFSGYTEPSHFLLNVYALAEGRFSPKKEEIIATKGAEYLSALETELRIEIEEAYRDAKSNRCSTVLWSNEGLYLLNSIPEYSRPLDLFTPHSTEVEVICCFREVQDFRDSYMKQLKKRNMSPSCDPDSYRYVDVDSWLFDYDRKRDILAKVFGKCTYFTYDPNDNIKKFMETIGLDQVNASDYRRNVTKGKRHRERQGLNADSIRK